MNWKWKAKINKNAKKWKISGTNSFQLKDINPQANSQLRAKWAALMSGGAEALLPDRLVLLPCLRQPIFQKGNIKTAKAQRFPSPRSSTRQRCFSSTKAALASRNKLQPAYTFLCKRSSRRCPAAENVAASKLEITLITASITSATASSRQSTTKLRPSSHPAKC